MTLISNISGCTYSKPAKNNDADSDFFSRKKSETHFTATEIEGSRRLESLIPKVEQDPELAKELTKYMAYTTDKLLTSLNKDAPRISDQATWAGLGQKSTDFDLEAADVTTDRIALYNKMKQNGSSDSEIFNAILDFNKTLPLDYQIKAGLLKIDTRA